MSRTGLALACLTTVAVLAACGSDDESAEATTTAPRPAASASGSGATETTQAQPAAADGVRLVGIGTFDAPLHVAAPPGDTRRVFVVEQGGTIRVITGGKRRSRPFLDIRSRVIAGGEQGLLSIAFAPDYATSRRFYVNYTDRGGTQSVVEYRRSKSSRDRADTGSARRVLRYDDLEANHNGGLVAFGPDRMLYIGTGDGGGGERPARRARQRAGSRQPARQAAAHRPPPFGRPGPTGCRRATRSSGDRARGPRSTPTGCATRGASPSTARPATSRSATSARTPSRRSTSRRRAGRAARTTAGGRSRARGGTSTSRRRVLSPPSSSSPTTTRTARSPAATSCATPVCPRCWAATSTATSASAGCARRSSPRLGPGRRADRRPGEGRAALLLRRGRARPRLRRVAGRAGLPARRRLTSRRRAPA